MQGKPDKSNLELMYMDKFPAHSASSASYKVYGTYFSHASFCLHMTADKCFSRARERRPPCYSYNVAFHAVTMKAKSLTSCDCFLRLLPPSRESCYVCKKNRFPTKKTKVTTKITYCPSCSNMVEHFMMSFL